MLLERGAEIATLANLIKGARQGTSAVGIIEGAAGLGKSRLLAEARDQARAAGMQVLAASARVIERDFGFGVVGQLFSRAAQQDPDRLLGDVAAPVAAIVTPERIAAAEVDDAPTFAALHGLYLLTVRLAEPRPLLLTVDDLHWCDAASLRFLAYLRTRLDGLPLLMLCTARPHRPSADPAALHGLLGDPATVWLRPRPLSTAAATALIESSLADAADRQFAATCQRITGGNPLLLEQLVSALAAEGIRPDAAHLSALDEVGPAAVASSVLLRLGRLGNDAVATAQALAVLGDGADLAHVAELAGLDVASGAHAVAALARIDLVRGDPQLAFVHPLVATAVYRDIPVGERGLRHLHAAQLLARIGTTPEQVAGHLLRAPARGDQAVVDELVQAAAVATGKGAAESAVAYLERALAEPPAAKRRAELATALGGALASRNGPAAVSHLRSAYNQLTGPQQRCEVAELLGSVLVLTGEADEGIRLLRASAAELPQDSDLHRRLEAYELWAVLFGTADPTELARLAAYRSVPVTAGTGAQMLAALAAVHWMYAAGPSHPVVALTLAALADGALVAAEPSWAAFALTTLTFADRTDGEHLWDGLTAAGYTRGSLSEIISIIHAHGEARWRRGELAEAEELVRECLAMMAQWGFTEPTSTYGHGRLAAIVLDRGDLSGARRAWSAARDVGANEPGTRAWLGCGLQLLLAEAAYDQAAAAADAYAERFEALVRNPAEVPWRSLKALAVDKLGRHGRALELAEAELELARAWGAPGTVARTLRTLGTLEGMAGIAHLEEAVATVAPSPARLEHARSLAALGAGLTRARRPEAARAPLHEALALATVCGADSLAARARTELHAAGGRPRRTAVRGVDSLTPTELRVARLAAGGRTNREIGEALFITPGTVAMHLSNSYRKLGVNSRHDLGTALNGDGPVAISAG